MMASSTRAPMAMAIPPSDMVLMVSPSNFRVISESRSESGMAISEISVVRTFSRKRNRMIITKSPPSNSTLKTFFTAVFMKSACRNKPELISRLPVREASRLTRAFSTSSVRVRVLILGCFRMVRITAGTRPRYASPILSGFPIFTRATSLSFTGLSFRILITEAPISPGSFERPVALTMYS